MNIQQFLTEHPSLMYASDLRAICQPLDHLGIKYFSHATIQEHQLSALATLPDFFELYFHKGYYNADLHAASFKLGESCILWDCVQRKPKSQALHEDFMSFNIGHTFSLVYNTGTKQELYHFAADLSHQSINGAYLQMLEPLKQFINYFKEKIAQHSGLRHVHKWRLLLKPEGYFAEEASFKIFEFLEQIKTNRAYSVITNNYLTSRELECLYWLGQGKTLQEAAIILNITHRTMKAHVRSIKNKLACENQFQLGIRYAQLAVRK